MPVSDIYRHPINLCFPSPYLYLVLLELATSFMCIQPCTHDFKISTSGPGVSEPEFLSTWNFQLAPDNLKQTPLILFHQKSTLSYIFFPPLTIPPLKHFLHPSLSSCFYHPSPNFDSSC